MPCALPIRSEEHTSELQSHDNLVCRLLLEKKTEPTGRGTNPHRHAVRVPTPHASRARGRGAGLSWVCGPGVGVGFGCRVLSFFFFNDTATTEIYTLSLTTLSD